MELRNDITLSSGRVITHTREPNGSQLATPTTGFYEMTNAEWIEYCDIVNPKTTKGVN
jgi:hypothetical protein